MNETQLQYTILKAVNHMADCRFWRNNVGATQRGKRNISYGLGVGSADLVGVVDGRFCALEVKTSRGRASPAQLNWMATVRDSGGFACVVRSIDDAVEAIARCRAGERL